MERVTGIEPAFKAWEALILPLNYTRNGSLSYNPISSKINKNIFSLICVERIANNVVKNICKYRIVAEPI